jgi:hypothetical protein
MSKGDVDRQEKMEKLGCCDTHTQEEMSEGKEEKKKHKNMQDKEGLGHIT